MAVFESTISVPAEDAAVQLAFEQLDARLNAWLSAMQQLGTILRHREDQAAPAAEEHAVPPAPELARGNEFTAAEPIAEVPSVPAVSTTSATPAQGLIAEPAVALGSVVSPVEPNASPPSAPATEKAAGEDEEALLATLDPETAKAIRVRRRLSTGRKSVRELLAEYNAEQGKSSGGEAGKRSWWRRGK
jgi:hypothetical protein